MAKKPEIEVPDDRLTALLQKYNLSEDELKEVLRSNRRSPSRKQKLSLATDHVKYGYFADPHIGHEAFKPDLWELMCERFRQEHLEFIVDAGDHLEGMSGRDGHVFELTKLGFQRQMEYAVELYGQLPAPVFGIDGNHDDWYVRKGNCGVIVGEELQRRLPDRYFHLGQGEGDIEIAKGVSIKLVHPNDGTAYAVSYKLQKLIESFTGGEKPNILHEGHYHKAMYMFNRNIHAFECGTLCGQTPFMRGKKIPAHMGFGIVDVYLEKRGVNRLVMEFVPYYE